MAFYPANDPYSPTSGGKSGQILVSNGEKLSPSWLDVDKVHEAIYNNDSGLFVVDINPNFISKKLPTNIKFIKNSTTTNSTYTKQSDDVILSVGNNGSNYVSYQLHKVSGSAYTSDPVTYRELREDVIYSITYNDQGKFYVSSGELKLPVDSPEINYSISMGRKEGTEIGENSVVIGSEIEASGKNSSASGEGIIARGDNQNVQGKYNVADDENEYAQIVGGGTSDDDRKNISTLDWDGNAVYAGDVKATEEDGEQVSLLDVPKTYAPLDSPELVGTPTAPTAPNATDTKQIATTAFVHSLVEEILEAYALLDSPTIESPTLEDPTLTGETSAPTPETSDNSTRIATTEFVKAVVDALIDGAPGTADTLKELNDLVGDNKEIIDVINETLLNKVNINGDNVVSKSLWDINIKGYSHPIIYQSNSGVSTVSYLKINNIFTNLNTGGISSVGFLLNSRGIETIQLLAGRDDNAVKYTARRVGNNYGKINALATDGTSLYVTLAAYSNRLKLQQYMGELNTFVTLEVVSSLPSGLTNIPIIEWSDSTHTHSELDHFKSTSIANIGVDTIDKNAIGYVEMGYNLFNQCNGALIKQIYNANYVGEIFIDYRTGQIATRGKNDGAWQAWRAQLDDQNFTTYVTPAKIGAAKADDAFISGRAKIAFADIDTYVTRNSGTYQVTLPASIMQLTVFRNPGASSSSLEFYNDYQLNTLRVRAGIDSNRYSVWKQIAFTDGHVESATNAASATNADKLDNIDSTGFSRAYGGSVNFGGNNNAITTAQFIAYITTLGAFNQPHWVARGSWSYAGNQYISDTGCGNIHLAGCTVEVFGTASAYTIRIMTPTTSTNGVLNGDFIYVNNGSSYYPGWRRLYSTAYKPTYADVGAAAASHGRHVPTACEMITDWNSAVTNGWYMGYDISNAPSTGNWYMGYVIAHNTNYVIQEAWLFTASTDIYAVPHYIRIKYSGTWGPWRDFAASRAINDGDGNKISTTYARPVYNDGGSMYTFPVQTSPYGYDLDTLYNAGLYGINYEGANYPSGSPYGMLLNLPWSVDDEDGNSVANFGAQIFVSHGDDTVSCNSLYVRTGNSGYRNEWVELAGKYCIYRGCCYLPSAHSHLKLEYPRQMLHDNSIHTIDKVYYGGTNYTSVSDYTGQYLYVKIFGALDGEMFIEDFAIANIKIVRYSGGEGRTTYYCRKTIYDDYTVTVSWDSTGIIDIYASDEYLTIYEVFVY